MHKTDFFALFLLVPIFLGACSYFGSTSDSQPATTQESTDAERIDEQKRARENEKRWNEATAKESLSISALKKKNPKGGIYETEGFVVDSYKCPCDSHGAFLRFCKCDPDSLTIAENTGENRGATLKILTDPSDFNHGEKYRFKIKIPETRYKDEEGNEVFLVAYRPSDK